MSDVNAQLDVVRAKITLNEGLKGLSTIRKNEQGLPPELRELIAAIPKDSLAWRGYEHCAVVSRLYAIYESFVEKLIQNWIEILPLLVLKYSDLDEQIRDIYTDNISRILRERKKQRFCDLSIEQIVFGLYHGEIDTQPYKLLGNAFTIHDRNLRKEDLELLLKNAAIHPNPWNWVRENRQLGKIVEEDNTAEDLLKELIDCRNNAAHGGRIDNVLGSREMLRLCDFIQYLCISLSQLATYQALLKQKEFGTATEVGKVTEWFPKPKAAIAQITNARLQIGDRLFLASNASCQIATIVSMQLDNIPQMEINISSPTEIGIRFDIDAREKLVIYKWDECK